MHELYKQYLICQKRGHIKGKQVRVAPEGYAHVYRCFHCHAVYSEQIVVHEWSIPAKDSLVGTDVSVVITDD